MQYKFIPFFKPMLGQEEERAIVRTLRSGWIGRGPQTESFENKISSYVGSRYAVGLSSCSAALHLSLLACGIKSGDEVITSPITFPATVNAIFHVGAKPVFVDVLPDALTIDPSKIEAAITRKTKAIIPVHLAGNPCAMADILLIARRRGLFVIEDAAHALGSEYQSKKIGEIGDLTCFSFYATKNITTGEGGMVTTNNKRFADKIRLLSLQGISSDAFMQLKNSKYKPGQFLIPGYKYNMFDIQATLGLTQLKKLEKFIAIRKRYAASYSNILKSVPGIYLPSEQSNTRHSWHLFVVQLKIEDITINRDDVINILRKKNIQVGIHYESLLHQPYFRKTIGLVRGNLPIADYVSDRIISLPLYPGLTDIDIWHVANVLRDILLKYRRKM